MKWAEEIWMEVATKLNSLVGYQYYNEVRPQNLIIKNCEGDFCHYCTYVVRERYFYLLLFKKKKKERRNYMSKLIYVVCEKNRHINKMPK